MQHVALKQITGAPSQHSKVTSSQDWPSLAQPQMPLEHAPMQQSVEESHGLPSSRQTQAPPTQVRVVQAFPQLPQLAGSLIGSTQPAGPQSSPAQVETHVQLPGSSSCPLGQPGTHVAPHDVVPSGHEQMPCVVSVQTRSAGQHVGPHSVWVAGQLLPGTVVVSDAGGALVVFTVDGAAVPKEACHAPISPDCGPDSTPAASPWQAASGACDVPEKVRMRPDPRSIWKSMARPMDWPVTSRGRPLAGMYDAVANGPLS
jgi:hypothetical protein